MLDVLIVDDDPLVADVMRATFEEYCNGLATIAATGADALDQLRRKRFDAAIIDTIMPDLPGFEVAALAADLHVPVLFTSGHPDTLIICQRHALGVLEKPFLPNVLAGRTLELIRESRQDAPMRAANFAALRQSIQHLRSVRVEVQRVLAESAAAQQRSAQVRYDPLGMQTLPGGASRSGC